MLKKKKFQNARRYLFIFLKFFEWIKKKVNIYIFFITKFLKKSKQKPVKKQFQTAWITKITNKSKTIKEPKTEMHSN